MEEKVLEILKNINDEIASHMEENLFDAGLLDSFQVIDLVLELEDAFQIEIDAKDVIEENFSTKEAIVALIKRYCGGAEIR